MSGKVNIKTVISFAGAYVATVIGSGFATGQEILQFFYVLWICGYYRWNNLYGTIFMVWSRSYR
nr:hypothetical protein [Clostridioides difficile]